MHAIYSEERIVAYMFVMCKLEENKPLGNLVVNGNITLKRNLQVM
jgi:hypothetical protein